MFDRELNTVDRVLFFGHRPGPGAARPARHQRRRPRAVDDLPAVRGDGAAAGDGVDRLVAADLLRLLVRRLAVLRVGARHRVLLRPADAGPGVLLQARLHRPRPHRHHRPARLALQEPRDAAQRQLRRPERRGHRQLGRRLRQPALRHHPAVGADGAVHRAQHVGQADLLDQLRAHRRGDPLLRLALRRRRRRRHHDRLRLLLPRRPGHRSALRPAPSPRPTGPSGRSATQRPSAATARRPSRHPTARGVRPRSRRR